MGPIHFVRKLLMFCSNGLYFLLGPIYKLFKSHVNCALMWKLRILGPIKFCKGPIKVSNGPIRFGNLHVFEWAHFKGPLSFWARIIPGATVQIFGVYSIKMFTFVFSGS